MSGCGDGNARIYEAKSGMLKFTGKGHEGVINALQVRMGQPKMCD